MMAAGIDQLLRKAYEGEVLGEAFVGRLCELTDDADHRAKLDVLRRLEASTKALLAPVIEQRGITVDDERAVRSGEQFADGASDLSWHDLMASLPEGTKQYAELYERMRGGLDDDTLVDQLLAHETALCDFSRRELAGASEGSVEPILALPHVR
jgi:hypothetical protein